MVCHSCEIFHTGILKGECRCKDCNCWKDWVFERNVQLNKPQRTLGSNS